VWWGVGGVLGRGGGVGKLWVWAVWGDGRGKKKELGPCKSRHAGKKEEENPTEKLVQFCMRKGNRQVNGLSMTAS